MKPQDIAILLKVMLLEGSVWTFRQVAADLAISLSEVSQGLRRLEKAKLYNPNTRKILRRSTLELINYAVKYVFPAEVGAVKKGIPTAHAVGSMKDEFAFDPSEIYVWPDPNGQRRGHALTPLYPNAVDAAQRDPQLHELLAAIDVIRIGRAREVKRAKAFLSEKIAV